MAFSQLLTQEELESLEDTGAAGGYRANGSQGGGARYKQKGGALGTAIMNFFRSLCTRGVRYAGNSEGASAATVQGIADSVATVGHADITNTLIIGLGLASTGRGLLTGHNGLATIALTAFEIVNSVLPNADLVIANSLTYVSAWAPVGMVAGAVMGKLAVIGACGIALWETNQFIKDNALALASGSGGVAGYKEFLKGLCAHIFSAMTRYVTGSIQRRTANYNAVRRTVLAGQAGRAVGPDDEQTRAIAAAVDAAFPPGGGAGGGAGGAARPSLFSVFQVAARQVAARPPVANSGAGAGAGAGAGGGGGGAAAGAAPGAAAGVGILGFPPIPAAAAAAAPTVTPEQAEEAAAAADDAATLAGEMSQHGPAAAEGGGGAAAAAAEEEEAAENSQAAGFEGMALPEGNQPGRNELNFNGRTTSTRMGVPVNRGAGVPGPGAGARGATPAALALAAAQGAGGAAASAPAPAAAAGRGTKRTLTAAAAAAPGGGGGGGAKRGKGGKGGKSRKQHGGRRRNQKKTRKTRK
jgi:hypothetical protein